MSTRRATTRRILFSKQALEYLKCNSDVYQSSVTDADDTVLCVLGLYDMFCVCWINDN